MSSRTPFPFEEHRKLLDKWVAKRKQIAMLEAEASDLLNERLKLFRVDVREQPFHREAIRRSMIAEHSAAAHLSQGTVERAFIDADAIHSVYPAVLESFRRGEITATHVREITIAGGVVREAVNNKRVDAGTLEIYAEAALAVAENDTPARTRAQARQIASVLAEETLRERHSRVARDREVAVRSLGDGLALLTAVLPEEIATAIMDRISQMSRHIVRSRGNREPVLDPELIDDGPDPIFPEDLAASSYSTPAPHSSTSTSAPATATASTSAPTPAPAPATTSRSGPTSVPTDDARETGAIFGESDTFTTDPLTTDPVTTEPLVTDSLVTDSAWADLVWPDRIPSDPMTDRDSACIERIPDDVRSIDEVRADLFADLLLVSDPSEAHGTGLDNITGHIQVTIAAKTLVGRDDRLAELDGHGPLHPDIVRDLAGRNGGWTRLFQDPTGMIVESDTYSPTERMRRHLRARDQHCRFPGCRMPVRRCEIDHNHDYAKGGRTCLSNLAHFCHAHHVLKHPDIHDDYRWGAQSQTDGSIAWYSPLGRVYLDQPPRRVMFVESTAA